MSSRAAVSKAPRWALLLAMGWLAAASPAAAQSDPAPGQPAPAPAEPAPPRPQPEPPAGDPAVDEPQGPVPPSFDPAALGLEPEDADDEEDRGFVSLTLATGAGVDDGVRFGDQELESDFYLARATLLVFRRPSARTEFTLAYRPEAEFHQEYSDLDAVDHALGALLTHRVTRRSRVLLGGSYLDGEDPGLHLGGSVLVLPRSPYRQARVYTGFEHRWRETAVLVHLSATRTEIEGLSAEAEEDGTAEPASLGLEQDELAGLFTVEQVLGARTDLSATYAYVHPDQTDAVILDATGLAVPLEAESEPLHSLATTLGIRPSDAFSIHLSGGAIYQGEQTDWLAGLALAGGSDIFYVDIGYEHAPTSLGPAGELGGAGTGGAAQGPALPSVVVREAVSDTASLRWTFEPISRFRWESALWGSRSRIGDATVESVSASTGLVIGLFERVGIFGELDYFQQTESAVEEDFTRLRYTAGLLFTMGELTGARGIQRDREHLPRVLPYRRTQ